MIRMHCPTDQHPSFCERNSTPLVISIASRVPTAEHVVGLRKRRGFQIRFLQQLPVDLEWNPPFSAPQSRRPSRRGSGAALPTLFPGSEDANQRGRVMRGKAGNGKSTIRDGGYSM